MGRKKAATPRALTGGGGARGETSRAKEQEGPRGWYPLATVGGEGCRLDQERPGLTAGPAGGTTETRSGGEGGYEADARQRRSKLSRPARSFSRRTYPSSCFCRKKLIPSAMMRASVVVSVFSSSP